MKIPDIEITAIAVELRNKHLEQAKNTYPSYPPAQWSVRGWVSSIGYLNQLKDAVRTTVESYERWQEEGEKGRIEILERELAELRQVNGYED